LEQHQLAAFVVIQWFMLRKSISVMLATITIR
jgi:hypothetical protein